MVDRLDSALVYWSLNWLFSGFVSPIRIAAKLLCRLITYLNNNRHESTLKVTFLVRFQLKWRKFEKLSRNRASTEYTAKWKLIKESEVSNQSVSTWAIEPVILVSNRKEVFLDKIKTAGLAHIAFVIEENEISRINSVFFICLRMYRSNVFIIIMIMRFNNNDL